MYIYKKKVVSFTDEERRHISYIIELLNELEEEMEGQCDFTSLINDLEEIRYKDFEIEDENHD